MNAETIKKNVAGRRPCFRLPMNSAADLQWYGQMAAQTQIFGSINPAEGAMIVGICHQCGISWLEFSETFNMIHHRISKKTDAILASLGDHGGTYELLSRTADKAEAKFKCGKVVYTSTVSWEECLTEPFIYIGKEEAIVNNIEAGNTAALVMKPKYRTKRSRMQMMWARCVSDGVRVVCPAACQGVYTPEEIEDIAEYDNPVPINIVAPLSAAPDQAPAAIPVEPQNIEVCNVGAMAGTRWDSMDDATLNLALQATFPDPVKNYIKEVLVSRATQASAAGGSSTTQQ